MIMKIVIMKIMWNEEWNNDVIMTKKNEIMIIMTKMKMIIMNERIMKEW